MSIQDIIARRQMDSLSEARQRIREISALSVTAIISPGRLARMTGEEDQVVQLKATDSSAMEFEIRRGSEAFDGQTKINISDLLSKNVTDPEYGHLTIPGTGQVAQKISNALHLISLHQDVSINDALKISENNPELKSYSVSGLTSIVDAFRNETFKNSDVEESPEISAPKTRR